MDLTSKRDDLDRVDGLPLPPPLLTPPMLNLPSTPAFNSPIPSPSNLASPLPSPSDLFRNNPPIISSFEERGKDNFYLQPDEINLFCTEFIDDDDAFDIKNDDEWASPSYAEAIDILTTENAYKRIKLIDRNNEDDVSDEAPNFNYDYKFLTLYHVALKLLNVD